MGALYTGENIFLDGGPDFILLDDHEQVAASLETDQSGAGNGGRRKLGMTEELQGVVAGMQDQCGRLDPANLGARHGGAIVEHDARAARRNRIHLLDHAADQLPLLGC